MKPSTEKSTSTDLSLNGNPGGEMSDARSPVANGLVSVDSMNRPSAELPFARDRLIAFYLPQFFPIPENDEWWGAGFTEWTNVAKSKPLYPGHWQPRLPADLGFYDLRVPETRVRQADLAREAGIESFCYWHYWFGHGRRILERPFSEVLASGTPDFPFCLAWANQSWTGIWHGNPRSVLIRQEYPGPEDEKRHYELVSPAFHDPRYTKVDGKPLFAIFAPHDLPSTAEFIRHWRRLAEADGLRGIFFVAISNRFGPGVDRYRHPIYDPFDAVTPLSPQDYLETRGETTRGDFRRRWRERRFGAVFERATKGRYKRPSQFDYSEVVDAALEDLPREERFLPSVLPNWDNTPRSSVRGVVFENATPELFARYLWKASVIVRDRPRDHRLIFLKAWNEWAEGNYVEPDARFGREYLEAIRGVMLGDNSGPAGRKW